MKKTSGLEALVMTPTRDAGQSVPRPARRMVVRVAVPIALILATLGTLLYAAREAILPAVQVRVLPVVARQAAIEQGPREVSAANNGPATVLAQAPGWVEPDPYPILVQSLVEGVVESVHVLEGDAVESNQLIATLVDADAALELERTDAELAMQQAAVVRAEAEVATVTARVAETKDEVDRKKSLVEFGGVAEGEFVRLGYRLQALEAEQKIATAAVQSAQASLHRAQVMQRVAALALERTRIRAPQAGVVLTRSVMPGTRISMAGNGPGEAHMPGLVSIYDPAHLQVRAEVPLADFGKIAIGTVAEVTTEALPGVTIQGSVIRIVHEADIQRNTVQVKVRLVSPPSVLKPDMLTRVRFLSGGASTDATTPSAKSADSKGALDLLLPKRALLEQQDSSATVWLAAARGANQAQIAQRQQIEIGEEVEPGYVLVYAGLQAGDRVIVDAPDTLTDGTRIEVLGEASAEQSQGGA